MEQLRDEGQGSGNLAYHGGSPVTEGMHGGGDLTVEWAPWSPLQITCLRRKEGMRDRWLLSPSPFFRVKSYFSRHKETEERKSEDGLITSLGPPKPPLPPTLWPPKIPVVAFSALRGKE